MAGAAAGPAGDAGVEATITEHAYPLSPAEQQELIGLWRSEWSRTDYDWLEALNGDYAETLEIVSLVARVDGEPAATATVAYARDKPAVCVIGNVVTLAAYRGRGLGQQVAEAAVRRGFAAGCQRAMLGSSQHVGNVYERCGFARVAGSIMRRDAPGSIPGDVFAPGRNTEIRPVAWGDMPGFAQFVAEPIRAVVIDYPRGLLSTAHADPVRCVSAFTVVRDEVQQRGGTMLVLAPVGDRQVLGLGTLTPGPAPGQRHRAIVEVAVHDNYLGSTDEVIDRLVAEATRAGGALLEAHVAVADKLKRDALTRAGFREVARLGGRLRLRNGMADVALLEAAVKV